MVVTPRARGIRTAVGREGLGLGAVGFQPWSGRWPAVVPVGWGAYCKTRFEFSSNTMYIVLVKSTKGFDHVIHIIKSLLYQILRLSNA